MTTTRKPATPLPWEAADREVRGYGNPRGTVTMDDDTLPQDAAYIAHAANAYPQLIAALRDAQTALDAGLNSGDAVAAAQTMDDAALMLRALLADLEP